MERLKYHLVAFVVVAIWGSTFVFTKMLLLAGLSPAQIFTLRFIIAYVLLLGYSFLRHRVSVSPPKLGGGRGGLNKRKQEADQTSSDSPYSRGENKSPFRWFCNCWQDELLMLALGLTGGSLYFLTENTAMNYTTTTNTSLIVSLSPLIATFLISLFFKSQRLNRIQTVGTLMAALGVVVVVLNGRFVLHLSPLGDSLAFGAALCWGFYSLLMIPACLRYDTLFITRKVFIYGLLTIIPYFIFRPDEASIFTTSILRSFNLSILLNLLFLGCVASMGCFLAWNWVLKKLGAVTATNYVYFNPVTTILFAWAILSEQITVYFLIGTIFILVGMYLADKRKS